MNRRSVLSALATAGGFGTASGCLGSVGRGSGSPTPTPVDLSGHKLDDRGGMEIGRHGGPNGQIFYAEHAPDGHDNPAWFHTLSFGLFPSYFEHERMGREAVVVYATDYSTVDYDLFERDGRTTISAPTAPDTFGNAETLTYVVESDVLGGMGPDFIPFSDRDDAEAFVSDHGGRTTAFGDVTPQFVARYTG